MIAMYATIQKWGNSQGLRIPRPILESLGIRENDRVELVPSGDTLTIKKPPRAVTEPWRSV